MSVLPSRKKEKIMSIERKKKKKKNQESLEVFCGIV